MARYSEDLDAKTMNCVRNSAIIFSTILNEVRGGCPLSGMETERVTIFRIKWLSGFFTLSLVGSPLGLISRGPLCLDTFMPCEAAKKSE